ncbi:MAG: hypothetical protein ACYCV0_19560, partial [Desulfitobacteriaceae bacterium]
YSIRIQTDSIPAFSEPLVYFSRCNYVLHLFTPQNIYIELPFFILGDMESLHFPYPLAFKAWPVPVE